MYRFVLILHCCICVFSQRCVTISVFSHGQMCCLVCNRFGFHSFEGLFFDDISFLHAYDRSD